MPYSGPTTSSFLARRRLCTCDDCAMLQIPCTESLWVPCAWIAPLTGRARGQVAYARWLISFGMELEDKKVRPRGSPPREGVLADLAQQLCAFPAHAPTCKFATFYRCLPTLAWLHAVVCMQPLQRALWLAMEGNSPASGWHVHCSMLGGCCLRQPSAADSCHRPLTPVTCMLLHCSVQAKALGPAVQCEAGAAAAAGGGLGGVRGGHGPHGRRRGGRGAAHRALPSRLHAR